MSGQIIEVVDLGFGDAGKGSMIDYLAMRLGAEWIVRFNGGPQAAHNVVLSDGRHHTFAQFGSATFRPDSRTLLSRFMMIEPYAMLNEAAHLAEIGVNNAMERTFIDERCLVVTPPQQIANRIRERARGDCAHGTCGMGIGECADDSQRFGDPLRAGEMRDSSTVRRKLRVSLDRKRSDLSEYISLATKQELEVFNNTTWIETAAQVYEGIAGRTNLIDTDTASTILRKSQCTIFEGAQGVLLDERYGFHPHTTWSKTTFTNADDLLNESGAEFSRTRLGIIRPYIVRHGNGPLVTEFKEQSRIPTEIHNNDDGWPGKFRRGALDLVMLRYAIRACGGLDALGLTHVDHLPYLPPMACAYYELMGQKFEPTPSDVLEKMADTTQSLKQAIPHYRQWPVENAEEFVSAIQSEFALPVCWLSNGQTREAKRELDFVSGRIPR